MFVADVPCHDPSVVAGRANRLSRAYRDSPRRWTELAAYRLEQRTRLKASSSDVMKSPGLDTPRESGKVTAWTRFLSLVRRGARGRP